MRKTIRQGITGYTMPMYMREILSSNLCPSFLGMTIVKEVGKYIFYYETGIRTKLDISRLQFRDKLTLLMTLMTINFENEEWLIKGDSYLIEPELIYSVDNSVEFGQVKLLFYPDFISKEFGPKLCSFADRIGASCSSEEKDILEQFKNAILTGDNYKARRVLEKNIDRLNFAKVV